MSDIVATAPAGGPSDPRQNGHRSSLVVDELGTFDPRLAPRGAGFDPTLEGPDLRAAAETGLDPVETWIDAMVGQPTPYTSETFERIVEQQTQQLDAEFRDLVALHDEQVEDELIAKLREQERRAYHQLAADDETSSTELLPGFEALTRGDLRTCPGWCVHADDVVHGDAFDTDPDTAEHRGLPRSLPILHGGVNGDRPGPAHLEVQLEQDRDHAAGPVVAMTITVDHAAQTVWMSPPEARALRHTLGGLLDDTDT